MKPDQWTVFGALVTGLGIGLFASGMSLQTSPIRPDDLVLMGFALVYWPAAAYLMTRVFRRGEVA